ncbi:FGGY-family carbohydrate kinase [Mangrovicella endophytica]|uniref:FGGY-family carbohydrate kinase n=1 Tax=Mangrovicella endophytica TaxID=2066697 RepID=UPI000C9E9D34|nr:FGGY-family carbohydrate kinase [Mangrovicella endophytica]
MPSLLGIDNGLTVTKAVIFDVDGSPLATARRRVPQSIPEPRRIERDMAGLWRATAEAIAEAVAACGRPASDIAAVAATAHGDGLYLLDGERQPLGPGILSLDSRAGATVRAWEQAGLFPDLLAATGQHPHVSAPSALLGWIHDHEPERFARIAHVLACKDWLRFCLTGTIGTDRTEASISFTDVRTQDYSPEALRLYGLAALTDALPPVAHSASIVGYVTAQAAALTGLAEGTPVAAGLHDVTASALGIGAHRPGVAGIVAGTYSINEVVTSEPAVDPGWFCRNAIEPGQWNAMSISPASAANYDWFLDTLCKDLQAEAAQTGGSAHEALGRRVEAALEKPSTLLFHPYLFGSPHGDAASGSFIGLRGWHDRSDMLRAVLEGIAFNHRSHVDALRAGFGIGAARLTGGISRNPVFVQLFADVLGLPVTVTATDEAAAWGAALCAGTAAGLYASVQDDPRDLDAASHTHDPDPGRRAAYDRRYRIYDRIVGALKPVWPEIEALDLEQMG